MDPRRKPDPQEDESARDEGPSLEQPDWEARQLEDGTPMIATIHPSYLLRIRDPDARAAERAGFVADLMRAWKLASG